MGDKDTRVRTVMKQKKRLSFTKSTNNYYMSIQKFAQLNIT